MNFTSLLIEYILSGFQVLIWIILLFLLVLGIDTDSLEKILDTDLDVLLLLLGLSLPVVYPLGMVLDDFAKILMNKWYKRIKRRYVGKIGDSSLRLLLYSDNDHLIGYMASMRTMYRIARSSAVNFFLIFLFLTLLGIFRLGDELGRYQFWFVLTTSALGVVSVFISIVAWRNNAQNYYRRLALALSLMGRDLKNS